MRGGEGLKPVWGRMGGGLYKLDRLARGRERQENQTGLARGMLVVGFLSGIYAGGGGGWGVEAGLGEGWGAVQA